MKFVNDKKNVEKIIKENSNVFIDESNSNMLFGLKFEEIVAKSLSSKSKLKEFFGALSQQQQQSTSPAPKDPMKQNVFPIVLLF